MLNIATLSLILCLFITQTCKICEILSKIFVYPSFHILQKNKDISEWFVHRVQSVGLLLAHSPATLRCSQSAQGVK